jgi:hypothetical protein
MLKKLSRLLTVCLLAVIVNPAINVSAAEPFDEKDIVWLNDKIDEFSSYHDGLAVVKIGGKYGYMDTDGVIVIPARYDSAGAFFEDKAVVRRGSQLGFINRDAKFTAFKLPAGMTADNYLKKGIITNIMYHEGFCWLYHDTEDPGNVMYDAKGKMFDTKEKGRYVLYAFNDGVVMTTHPETYTMYLDAKGNIALDSAEVVRINGLERGKNNLYAFDGGYALEEVPDADGIMRTGLINKKGEMVIEPQYYGSYSFHFVSAGINWPNAFEDRVFMYNTDGIYSLVNEEGKVGGVNANGEVVIPFEFYDAFYFKDGYSRTHRDGKYGLIDKTGEYIIPLEYNAMGFYQDGYLAVAYDDDNGRKWGIIDIDGNEIVPIKYHFVSNVYEGQVLVSDEPGHVGIYQIK